MSWFTRQNKTKSHLAINMIVEPPYIEWNKQYEKNKYFLVLSGSLGGSTIIILVYQAILNDTEFGMNIKKAVNAKKTLTKVTDKML